MTETVQNKIAKLLEMANHGGGNENEAAVALEMAQKLADAHNLELSDVGKSGNGRDDKQINKGLYPYQRTLYESLAELNHCMYFFDQPTRAGQKYIIRLLGSKVNVASARTMAEYVEDVVNRFVKENMVPQHHYFSKASHEYREGMIDRLVQRIIAKREAEEEERRRAKAEQDARSKHPGAATENAIVLMDDVAEREAEANYDHLHGEGAWARSKAEKARREAEMEENYRVWQEKREQWKLDNPEEWAAEQKAAAKRLEKHEKEQERSRRRAEKRRQERIDLHGFDPQDFRYKRTKHDSRHYQRGTVDGDAVNLDTQIERDKRGELK